MKKFLIIGLLSISQIGFGMDTSNNNDILSGRRNSQPLIPVTKDKYTVEEEIDVYNGAVKIEVKKQGQNNSVLYNSCAQKSDSNIDYNSLDVESGKYLAMIFIRHIRDRSNLDGVSHGKEDSHHDTNLTPDIVGPNQIAFLMSLARIFKIDVLVGGRSYRHKLTGDFISSFAPPTEQLVYEPMEEFDEQNIGYLKGMRVDEIMETDDFKKADSDPNYKIDDTADTGSEIMDRVARGIIKCVNKVKPRDGDPKLACIVSSRCTMNQAHRRITGNPNLSFRADISNCGCSIATFDLETNQFHMLCDYNGNPIIISPEEGPGAFFKLPALRPFMEGFYKKSSQVMLQKNKSIQSISDQAFSEELSSEKDISEPRSRTISRSSSFYIESEPAISRCNSLKEKRSLTN